MMNTQDYELLDSGRGLKLERFGPHRIVRPAAQAVWDPLQSPAFWKEADACFARTEGKGVGAAAWIARPMANPLAGDSI